jgi:lysophospholipase L1-like esterase
VINELGGEDANIFVCKTAQVYVPTSLGGDGWHPDEEGALRMAKKLVSTINTILKDKAEAAE